MTRKTTIPLFAAVLFVLFLGAGCERGERAVDQSPERALVNALPSEGAVTPDGGSIVAKKEPVLIYTEVVESTKHDNRLWPTLQIYRKVGTDSPEPLAVVGGVGEYPEDFVLSRDKATIFATVGGKLQAIDLQSGTLRDLFSPQYYVQSITLDPMGSELLVWDQEKKPEARFLIHRFSMTKKTDAVLSAGAVDGLFKSLRWRDDDKIVFAKLYGSFSTTYYIDIAAAQMTKTPGNYASGPLSENGQSMASVTNWITDACNTYSGEAPAGYHIIDPVSGNVRGEIRAENEEIVEVILNADGTEVLYSTRVPRLNNQRCNQRREKKYFLHTFIDEKTQRIGDLGNFLVQWGQDYIGAELQYDNEEEYWTIAVGGTPVVRSSNALRILSQYYQ